MRRHYTISEIFGLLAIEPDIRALENARWRLGTAGEPVIGVSCSEVFAG
jgi:hypothetical protein